MTTVAPKDKTWHVLKADAKGTNGVAPKSHEGVVASLQARGVPADHIVGHESLKAMVDAASKGPPEAAALVVPGGNALFMKQHIESSTKIGQLGRRTKDLVAAGACYIGICAGSILASKEMVGHSFNRRALPEDILGDLQKAYPQGSRAQVETFLKARVYDMDISSEEAAKTVPKPAVVGMLGLAAGVRAEAFAFFAAHAGAAAGTLPVGIDARTRMQDGSVARIPNIAGPILHADGKTEVVGTYENFQDASPAIVRIALEQGTVTLSAVHPELPTDDAREKSDRAQVFDEVFGFEKT